MGTRASKARRSPASQEERHVGADAPAAIEPKGATVGTMDAAAVTAPEDAATALSGAAAEAGGGDAEPEATRTSVVSLRGCFALARVGSRGSRARAQL